MEQTQKRSARSPSAPYLEISEQTSEEERMRPDLAKGIAQK